MKAVASAAVLALSLSACSGEQTSTPAQIATSAPPADTAASASEATAGVQPAETPSAVSRFIPFSTCKDIQVNEEEDWAISKCGALAGYTVFLDYGDARDDLRIVPKGGKEVSLGMSVVGGGGFNTLGPTFEWRGQGEGAAFQPRALIVRNAVSQDPEHSERQTSMLAVIDLKKLCIVALVRPGPGQNAQAQAIADGGREDCLALP